MPKDWINHLDSGLVAQSRVMSVALTADPGSFGVSIGDAARLATAKVAYAEAYIRAAEPSTRTTSAVCAKRQAKESLIAIMRELARKVNADVNVTPEQKVNIGLPSGVRAPRKRVPAPMTQPRLLVESAMEQRLVLRVLDVTETGGYRRARAADAVGADVFVFIARDDRDATEPPALVSAREGWQYAGRYSGLFQLDLPAMPPGTPVFVSARWANRRGETGPLCRPIRVHMGGGVVFGRSSIAGIPAHIGTTPAGIAA